MDTRGAIKRKFVESRSNLNLNVLGLIMVHQSSIYKQNRPFVEIYSKNLIDYSLEQASESEFLTDIVVSSDDREVENYIEDSFPKIIHINRDKKLSDFNANTVDIVTDAIEKAEAITNKKYDAICILSVITDKLFVIFYLDIEIY